MAAEYLLDGYVVRVAVVQNQWRISLHRLKTGEHKEFDSFQDLTDYLVLTSVKQKPFIEDS